MTDGPILQVFSLGAGVAPWPTLDPFLFCVHHDDAYPAGNEQLGPAASLAGRRLGEDFAGKDGWRMYHGETVPGFPQHPHRGFETVTLVRRGLIDHSDSLGAAARFGRGDAQWLTAGAGIVHSEMFPLLARDAANPVELFQIWLNLPRASKMVAPYFSMLWADAIPHVELSGTGSSVPGPESSVPGPESSVPGPESSVPGPESSVPGVAVTVVAGALGEQRPPAPPPDSWAARADSDVAIWSIRLAAGASWTLPAARAGSNRALYFFAGRTVTVAGRVLDAHAGIRLRPDVEVPVVAGDDPVELLLLQGRPIGEQVVQHGPFVMNSPAEIQQAFLDYQRTRFGGWPWPSDDPTHGRDRGRFARHADGRVEDVR